MTDPRIMIADEADRVAEIARGLDGNDADMIAGAWQAASGRWYVEGPCRHLYGIGLCRMTGVLTTLGERLRAHLQDQTS